LWSRRAIHDLIQKEFGIELAVRTVGDYYLGGKEPHLRTSGVLDRGVLKEVADMLRQMEQSVHE